MNEKIIRYVAVGRGWRPSLAMLDHIALLEKIALRALSALLAVVDEGAALKETCFCVRRRWAGGADGVVLGEEGVVEEVTPFDALEGVNAQHTREEVLCLSGDGKRKLQAAGL